jgi:type IV secretion system protein TrbF
MVASVQYKAIDNKWWTAMGKMKYKSSLSYPNEGTNDTPFNNNLKEFDEFIGESRRRERAWRRVSFVLLSFLLASALGWLYVSSLPKAVPYVIEVQPWGESKYMGNIGEAQANGIAISDASWRYYLRKFIEYTREISPDRQVTLTNLGEAYSMVTQTGSGVLTNMLKSENAFSKIGGDHRDVRLETLIKVTAKSWQADWVEVVSDASGDQKGSVRKRGIYTVLQTQADEKQIKSNPLGIFVDSFQIENVEQGNQP